MKETTVMAQEAQSVRDHQKYTKQLSVIDMWIIVWEMKSLCNNENLSCNITISNTHIEKSTSAVDNKKPFVVQEQEITIWDYQWATAIQQSVYWWYTLASICHNWEVLKKYIIQQICMCLVRCCMCLFLILSSTIWRNPTTLLLQMQA